MTNSDKVGVLSHMKALVAMAVALPVIALAAPAGAQVAGAQCEVTPIAGGVLVSWDEFNGEDDEYQVRADGLWVDAVSVDEPRFFRGEDGVSYSIRSREGGDNVDLPCGDAGEAECTVTNIDGGVRLSWDAFNGEDDVYIVRADGDFVARVDADAALTFVGERGVDYIIRSTEDGIRDDLECGAGGGGGGGDAECTLTTVGNDVRLSWDAFNGEDDSYIVRGNGDFVATVDADGALTFRGEQGVFYLIRSVEDGRTSDLRCGEGGGGAGAECLVTVDGDGVRLSWEAFNGENDDYQVRGDGVFVASVPADGALAFRGEAGVDYVIRSREDGRNVDLPCGDGASPVCTVTAAGDGVLVTWEPFNGENDDYQVRGDGVFVASVPADGALSFDGEAGVDYVIRSREGGNNRDLTCV